MNASSRTPKRSRSTASRGPAVRLRAAVQRRSPGADLTGRREPELPWWLAAIGGGFVAAGVSFLVCTAIAVFGWLGASAGTFSGAVTVGAQLWFLTLGGGARLLGETITLAPLGLTVLWLLAVHAVAGYATRQALRVEKRPDARASVVRRVVGGVTGGYVAAVLLAASLFSENQQVAAMLLGSLALAGAGSLWASAHAAEYRLNRSWPRWAQALPRAVAAALATMAAAGAAIVALACFQNRADITLLSESMQLPVIGLLVMLAIQLAYLPNIVLWAGSFLVGAGFSLGDGSQISPVVSQLGLLPAIPLTGAVPSAAVHGNAALWWLLVAGMAGAVAAMVALRARPAARLDEASLVGGFAGALSGIAFAALTLLSRGNLGSGRLVGLGPVFVEVAVLASTVMGLAGLLTGLVLGLVPRVFGSSRLTWPRRGKDGTFPTEDDSPEVGTAPPERA